MLAQSIIEEFRFLKTGSCRAHERMILGRGRNHLQLPCTIGVLRHNTHGLILYDTGYSEHFLTSTENWPNRLYRLATPLSFTPEQSASRQLRQLGYRSEDVKYIVISHFHGDHVSGLRDFPNARFLAHSQAWLDIKGRRGLAALRHSYLPEVLPGDFAQRFLAIDKFGKPTRMDPSLGFDHAFDLFADGSLLAVPLPGHALGHLGLLFKTQHGDSRFLIGDASWTYEGLEQQKLPHLLTYLIHRRRREYQQTFHKLSRLTARHPEITLLPCHCPKTFERYGEILT